MCFDFIMQLEISGYLILVYYYYNLKVIVLYFAHLYRTHVTLWARVSVVDLSL